MSRARGPFEKEAAKTRCSDPDFNVTRITESKFSPIGGCHLNACVLASRVGATPKQQKIFIFSLQTSTHFTLER